MSLPKIDLLVDALTNVTNVRNLSESEWDLLIRLARSANVISRLATTISEAEMMESIPQAPRLHLISNLVIATRQQRELSREIDEIAEALLEIDAPVVLLKGAAYTFAKLPVAKGRMVSDVDILVPHSALASVESALMMRGWVSAAKTPYDQHYYRTWMHELPPMCHFRRGTIIDVHHAILPTTAKLHPSSDSLLDSAIHSDHGSPKLAVLAPVDMLLHSATHLFHESEFNNGFRDLVDLDSLIRHFGANADFWPKLIPRAVELELQLPLFYAFRYSKLILGTPIPLNVQSELDQIADNFSFRMRLRCLDFCFLRALRPAHKNVSDLYSPLARWILYVRGHWLRMPPALLAYHLSRKFLINMTHGATKN